MYDRLSASPGIQPTGTRFAPVNYYWPVVVADEELWQNENPEARLDITKTRAEAAYLAMRELQEQDLFYGNSLDDRKPVGMEDIFYAVEQYNNILPGAALQRWQLRQQDNPYGTITRVPYTSLTAGGTGLEAVTMDFDPTGITPGARFGLGTEGVWNSYVQALEDCYAFAGYGDSAVDVMISDQAPYRDMQSAVSAKQRITSETGNFLGGDIAMPGIRFNSAWWTWSDWAKSASINGDDATAGKSNVYGFTTRYHELRRDPRLGYKMTDRREPQDQLSGVNWLLDRIVHWNPNPRTGFRIYDYGV
jgi:hypothetical protein